MSRHRTRDRARWFGDVLVMTARRDGAPVGSLIRYGGLTWSVPAWPYRVADVQARERAVVVRYRDGVTALLEEGDAR